ncbi:MAG: hypothetical protein J0649_00015 [Methylococcales bacterium]|nr:hypothetical protein [Methylococcales bacterium]
MTSATTTSTAYATAVTNDNAASTAWTAVTSAKASASFSDSHSTASYVDSITDLDTTLDHITLDGLKGFSLLSASDQSTATAASSLSTALSGVAATSTDFAVFTYGENAYVYIDAGTDNVVDDADLIVEVVGVSAANLVTFLNR